MHSKGSGNMKMSEEEIKKYTEAISKNSDNLFVCPRPVGAQLSPNPAWHYSTATESDWGFLFHFFRRKRRQFSHSI